ncbi:MAG: hypothetical protein OXI72_09745 [Gemmatimonadota bacterium]|nr:hypothetical protein [Gemmatimonadota bacterium]
MRRQQQRLGFVRRRRVNGQIDRDVPDGVPLDHHTLDEAHTSNARWSIRRLVFCAPT